VVVDRLASPVLVLILLSMSKDLSSAIEDNSGGITNFTGPLIGVPVIKG